MQLHVYYIHFCRYIAKLSVVFSFINTRGWYCVMMCVCVAAQNRATLRDVNIVKRIIMFLAEQKYQELHVFAIMLLANCVEDADIVKVIAFLLF